MFDTEYDAFKTYCEIYPTNATLLVDTYNTLKSGDMAYLTRKARKMLDDAGWTECKITCLLYTSRCV